MYLTPAPQLKPGFKIQSFQGRRLREPRRAVGNLQRVEYYAPLLLLFELFEQKLELLHAYTLLVITTNLPPTAHAYVYMLGPTCRDPFDTLCHNVGQTHEFNMYTVPISNGRVPL